MTLSQKHVFYDGRNELDPVTRRAIDSIASQITAGLKQTTATPSGHTPPPPQVSQVNVLAADGIFDVQIQDNNDVQRGIEYFLEFSESPSGPWTVVPLGPSRNWRRPLGNLTLYWRAYSQYPTSSASHPQYFGGASAPTAVVGGGVAGPALQPSTGSGTAPNNGLSGGEGYGRNQSRNVKVNLSILP